MTTTQKRSRWERLLTVAWIIVAALAFYPLSIGPVAAIVDHTSGYRKNVVNCGWLFRIYRPILLLARRPAIGKPLSAYLNLCARRTYVPYAEYDERCGIITSNFDHPLKDSCFQ